MARVLLAFVALSLSCGDVVELCPSPTGAGCGPNSHCENLPGATCVCDDGFHRDAGACVDVDECAPPDAGACPPSTACRNTPGGFLCE